MATNDPTPVITPGSHLADPAPLGLAAFALTTAVLSAVNAGWVPASVLPVVFGLTLAYGGIAQFAAGMWEFARGNTFGATAFGSYGAFWLSYWWLTGHSGLDKIPAKDASKGLGLYLLVWGIFTIMMTVATSRIALGLFAVFVLLSITFLLLAWGNFATSDSIIKAGGYVGLATAVGAWYMALAGVLSFTHKRSMLPIGPR